MQTNKLVLSLPQHLLQEQATCQVLHADSCAAKHQYAPMHAHAVHAFAQAACQPVNQLINGLFIIRVTQVS